ncbi:hypothetical protein L227DRAFT_503282 [Lentinus tigrinus ALCF2SS1-6]|uniref:Integrase core domain-containing protein n=1 Tax=Lentinus tigrinus ALCF2SS1-6 TaxID=1328759 RepID=A0A5C2S923_9APHY|nr:hypothetical protein L227DRAFT_503282 [Lentinus tigrinus ALCF2SS1-6]
MEEHRGLNRGSYIWGRSVHNTRIERLWYDVTSGFGRKWKEFFQGLEETCELDHDDPEHIWLLHHLFLAPLNEDAQEWAAAWNAHKLHVRGERAASPLELFIFGMTARGPRGLDLAQEEAAVGDDVAAFGIDWDTIADPVLMRHHQADNPGEHADAPLLPSARQPAHLSHVPCEPPGCPLSHEQVTWLNAHLVAHFDLGSRDMLVRRHLWTSALEYCRQVAGGRAFRRRTFV